MLGAQRSDCAILVVRTAKLPLSVAAAADHIRTLVALWCYSPRHSRPLVSMDQPN